MKRGVPYLRRQQARWPRRPDTPLPASTPQDRALAAAAVRKPWHSGGAQPLRLPSPRERLERSFAEELQALDDEGAD